MATVVLPETTRALYPFKSHFLTLSDGKRMHYVDEGPEDGEVLVFAHGYPLWSFVYRAFVVYYAAQGYRCIAMDHIGYGLSDKPTGRHYHTVRRHIHNVMECLTVLNVHAVTLVMEDWGCPLALGYAIRYPENVKRLVILNSWAFQDTFTNRLNRFIHWTTQPGIGDLLYGTLNLVFTWGVQHWTARRLSSAVLAAYKAPFRDPRNRTALIQFPRMINIAPTHPSASTMREIEQGLATLTHIPALILWGERDSLFPPEVAHHWKKLLPRSSGPVFMSTASHFPAEDDPDLVIEHLDAFLDRT
jgi:pimeloyl-ACP methyl ester carboxylesterase